MRRATTLTLVAAAIAAGGCRQSTVGDNVRAAYDNKADAIDAQATQQPTPTAKKIYEARADAIREEGKDREKGLEGGEPTPSADAAKPTGG